MEEYEYQMLQHLESIDDSLARIANVLVNESLSVSIGKEQW
jgi:hypothetical protein